MVTLDHFLASLTLTPLKTNEVSEWWSGVKLWRSLPVNLPSFNSLRSSHSFFEGRDRKEGWPCTGESFSEFNRQSRKVQHSPFFPALGTKPPGSEWNERQAARDQERGMWRTFTRGTHSFTTSRPIPFPCTHYVRSVHDVGTEWV